MYNPAILMDRFYLETDESLEERCGEIFRTTKGRITFFCTLCQEEAYYDFNSYLAHLNKAHLFAEINIKIEETTYLEETEVSTENSEILLPLESIELKKDPKELMLSAEKKSDNSGKLNRQLKRNKTKNASFKSNLQKSKTKEAKGQEPVSTGLSHASNSEKNYPPSLKIPREVREVNKRVIYKAPSAPFADEERKHKCPVCEMRFKNKWHLAYHFKRHTTERNFSCSECDKKFFTSAELKSHFAHIHTKKRSLLCTECGRTFFSKSTLGAHIKRHQNQRDYVCTVCKKAFFDSRELRWHALLHSSEKSFSCNFCDVAFKQPAGLRNHLKLHKNKREYKCELCETEFNQKAGLLSHMKASHKVVKDM